MEKHELFFDTILIGGGLAGLSAAIHLSKAGQNVLLIEKNSYPKHKVCGEYISNEVLPYLFFLGIDVFELGAQKINKFQLSTRGNKSVHSVLPLGGFGISRYTLDEALAKKATENGCQLLQDSVLDVLFSNDSFTVETKDTTYFSKMVIGSYGKRSSLDIKMSRSYIKQKSPFLAVKMHVKGDFPDDLVALHNFKGGYCGVSKVENDTINLCYITTFESFKTCKDIEEFQRKVVFENKYLKSIFCNTTPVFETPLTISQISFASKNPIENHILMCGDTAGLIHPLCGNGMSMAIRSAQMASELILEFADRKITTRLDLENAYTKAWNAEFKTRLKIGRLVANLFSKDRLSTFLMRFIQYFPGLLPPFIKLTHGKTMVIK